MKTYIYILIDPRSGAVRYVGKADNPRKRYIGHISVCKKPRNYRECWIRSLVENNIKPEMVVIDEIDQENWQIIEQYYISLFRSWGFNLVNSSDGGEGASGITASKSAKARGISKETREKMIATRKKNGSYTRTEEDKIKISKGMMGRPKPPNSGVKGQHYYFVDRDNKIVKEFLNQQEVATYMGCSQTIISGYLRGKIKRSNWLIRGIKLVSKTTYENTNRELGI